MPWQRRCSPRALAVQVTYDVPPLMQLVDRVHVTSSRFGLVISDHQKNSTVTTCGGYRFHKTGALYSYLMTNRNYKGYCAWEVTLLISDALIVVLILPIRRHCMREEDTDHITESCPELHSTPRLYRAVYMIVPRPTIINQLELSVNSFAAPDSVSVESTTSGQ